MGVAYYVGAAATEARNVERRLTATADLDVGISRSWVSGRVAEAAALKAPKSYVTTQDSQYALASYFVNQDAALLPLAQKGAAGGVATLNVSGKVPNAQVPFLGSGMVRGPYGLKTTVVASGSTDDTPVRIADLYTGKTGVTGMLWAFVVVGIQATGGRPVVEVRVGTSLTATAYASQTLVAAARGREFYNAAQVLSVIPVPAVTAMNNTGSFTPSADLLVQAWMYNEDPAGTVTINTGQIYSSALFLAKTAV